MPLPRFLERLMPHRPERDGNAPYPPAPTPRGGFAEAPLGLQHLPRDPLPLNPGGPHLPGFQPAAELPFPSTGPEGHRGRMREKLLTRGLDSLADYELLEMLLFQAMPKGDTKPLAKALVNRFGSFARVLAAPVRVLLETKGLGPHSVTAIKLVEASALRMMKAEVQEAPVLNNWDRLTAYLQAAMSREKTEIFRVLFLDTRNRLIADEAQGRGTVNHTPVYPREVVKRALELHATALILVHNHPSGDTTPSQADLDMTQEIKSAAAMLGIVVHDHLIVGNGTWLSFRREGYL
jgi:DNA repair protein RadC